MERTPRDYANGKIYMIESLEGGIRYIGSTCSELRKRMSGHKQAFTRHKAGANGRITSFNVLAYPDARILLIEDFPCERLEQLTAREAHHIRNTDCVNRNIPGRTSLEYYQDTREVRIAQAQRHHIENREKKLEQMKRYYQANRDKQLEQMRLYRIANKAELTRKVECPICRCSVSIRNMPRHEITAKHIEALERSNNADDQQDLAAAMPDLVADISAV